MAGNLFLWQKTELEDAQRSLASGGFGSGSVGNTDGGAYGLGATAAEEGNIGVGDPSLLLCELCAPSLSMRSFNPFPPLHQ